MISLESVSCSYATRPVLDSLSARLNASDFTIIIGPNGAGKSTLFNAIMGFMPLNSGRIRIFDRDLRDYSRLELARLISFVPQESSFTFDYRVEELVLMGRYPHLGLMQSWGETDRLVAAKALQSMGLDGFGERWYSRLSGGEKQRVLIARALAQETRFIFLDESLSQLDINFQLEIMNLLQKVHRESGQSIVLISHNLNLAANYASRLIFLKEGRILAEGSPDALMNPAELRDLFGLELRTALNPLSGRMNIVYPGAAKNL
ncbi:MAG TPA: ABC transporter ATP-binding protein [Candidatus Cloacimonadota bacterium]|nr:ABC transporter ATP-binding protein [Candidatus Cloacimonadota bacterium]